MRFFYVESAGRMQAIISVPSPAGLLSISSKEA